MGHSLTARIISLMDTEIKMLLSMGAHRRIPRRDIVEKDVSEFV
jgi:hypothetical protein